MVVAGIGAAVPSCGLHEPTLMAPTRVVMSSDVGVEGCFRHEAPPTTAASKRQERRLGNLRMNTLLNRSAGRLRRRTLTPRGSRREAQKTALRGADGSGNRR